MAAGVVAVSAAGDDSCAVTTLGQGYCWGDNLYGQLGDGTTDNRSLPQPISGVTKKIIAISTSGGHSCAVTISGGAYFWGRNLFGELGDGTTVDRVSPVPVLGLSVGVVAITTGDYDSCAVTTSGAADCWGYNGYGQLGDGTQTDRQAPVRASGLPPLSSISTAYANTCAVTRAGAIYCWGEGANLPTPTPRDSWTPLLISSLPPNMASISVGQDHGCATTTAGAAYCWGNNWSGALGDGTVSDSTKPGLVVGLSQGVEAVTAGAAHTCAIASLGTGFCWGMNVFGQLGKDSQRVVTTPAAVSGPLP